MKELLFKKIKHQVRDSSRRLKRDKRLKFEKYDDKILQGENT